MKRLLVASDLSHRSDLAVAQALFLARRFGVPLTVLQSWTTNCRLRQLWGALRRASLTSQTPLGGTRPRGSSA